MKFKQYLNELASDYGAGVTFVDIDECIFNTFAKILVRDKETKKIIRELDNQEFNSYQLKDTEEYDFIQFGSAKIFHDTSIPIPKTINRIKKMLKNIDANKSNSKIVFLTARSDFDDKKLFLKTFEKYGIKMDKPTVYVERSGNLKTGTIPERKKKIMMKYIETGLYRRVRLLDDHKPNVDILLELEKEIPQKIIDKIKKNFNIPEDEKFPVIQFFPLLVNPDGSLKRIK